ncbi:hypothetical protein JQM69_02145 [Faecalicatena contorta]|uniref:SpaA isopeptide-forming pilin-related protein n=1 Tax=Faecalicatena contorta TaxID=39482 RepID=UPI001F24D771|nr:SpaA isopeptide-forming pilin-related protein [Faecalicatena contorta]MCF2679514.1 hypothetical protein [Faecalicatena contorta]
MKRIRKILGLLLCCVMLAGLLPNVVSAATTETFRIMKVDKEGNPLSGAKFALIPEGQTEPTYSAISDNNGYVIFSGVDVPGTYELKEIVPPTGYEKSGDTLVVTIAQDPTTADTTVTNVTIDGKEYNPNNLIQFVNVPEQAPQEIVDSTIAEFELPFTKIVEQTGERTPDKQTFEFEVFDFLNESGAVTVTGNTIETNGKGNYKGTLKLTFTDESYKYNSFCVREKKGTADGWTYSDEVWCVVYNQATDGYDLCKVVNGEAQLNDPQAEMTFTNSYCAKKVLAAETGDMSNMLIWTVLLLTGCFAVIGTTVYKRRYQK